MPLSCAQRNSAGASIILYEWQDRHYAGEVLNLFHHIQRDITDSTLFAELRWMKEVELSPIISSNEKRPWDLLYVFSHLMSIWSQITSSFNVESRTQLPDLVPQYLLAATRHSVPPSSHPIQGHLVSVVQGNRPEHGSQHMDYVVTDDNRHLLVNAVCDASLIGI